MKRECELCGALINPKRLAALPDTTICLTCQKEAEENGSFKRSRIEVSQEIKGWSFDGLVTKVIKGSEV